MEECSWPILPATPNTARVLRQFMEMAVRHYDYWKPRPRSAVDKGHSPLSGVVDSIQLFL